MPFPSTKIPGSNLRNPTTSYLTQYGIIYYGIASCNTMCWNRKRKTAAALVRRRVPQKLFCFLYITAPGDFASDAISILCRSYTALIKYTNLQFPNQHNRSECSIYRIMHLRNSFVTHFHDNLLIT